MAAKRSPSRQKLIDAALDLFASQGITDTTTRQIAERAGVNEVTLFRQFGNKHGLLLSALEETEVFTGLARALAQEAAQVSSLEQALRDYADGRLHALEAMPEFVRSLVGESGQYPPENRQSLGRELTQANRLVAQYLEAVMLRGQFKTRLPVEKLSSFLNSLLLGYAVLEFTSEFHQLWDDRQDFLNCLVALFLYGGVQHDSSSTSNSTSGSPRPCDFVGGETLTLEPSLASRGIELPQPLVHDILKAARAQGPQDYALVYVMFAAGLSLEEIAQLERYHQICDRTQHLIQVPPNLTRMVPVNQWILGKRYGSYLKNPLTQWLKTRKDHEAAIFLNVQGAPTTAAELADRWQRCTAELLVPGRAAPGPERAQDTWRVEMLMRGMSAENLSLLTGISHERLEPYLQRAQVKRALEQALGLDRQNPSSPDLEDLSPS